ncbi:MAG: hypothetical protein H6900_00260 [Rhodobacter sp.]|uniref:hypothetical protein n=1 Tax=Pararhodobacter sp. TaxID=2127056 RepID=UPI001E0EA6CF|nr:hypothetical protein [Pararhodobacter sp.]MCB1345328.1 hypothetical protein [Paracoccaceae bacterium]MCC0071698.1 hypothetical protein [Rhodobacter sp.]HPD93828.1 hypothetical protein [Pararhodobacter sp.]
MRSIPLAALALALALPALSPPALAQVPSKPDAAPQVAPDGPALSAEAFDAYTLGRTLSYAFQGTPYGVEQYLPDRQVRWAFNGDDCQDGHWYERGGNICFVYDNAPDNEQCWRFYQNGDGLRGVFQGPDGPGTELYEVQQNDRPMACLGPGVGV